LRYTIDLSILCFTRVFVLTICTAATNTICAQQNDQVAAPRKVTADQSSLSFVNLTVGSPAPALDIQHWLSDGAGKWPHITKFQPNKVYLVEFWATWCGPCIKSMPSLVELQDKYADQGVQIVSISDEPLPKVQGFLTRTVPGLSRSNDDKDKPSDEPVTYGELTKSYSLTADPDGSVGEQYMGGAAQNGIPCGFVVGKTGLIEWIGHPARVESVLAAVVEDRWDREAFAKEFKPTQLREAIIAQLEQALGNDDMQRAKAILAAAKSSAAQDSELAETLAEIEFQMMIEPVQRHLEYGEFDDALARLDQIAKIVGPSQQTLIAIARLTVLLKKGAFEDAAKTIQQVVSTDKSDVDTLYTLADRVAETAQSNSKVSGVLIDAGLAAAEKAAVKLPNHPVISETIKKLTELKSKAGSK
jgi:thiol-disulfide isomerase/thioredoxin